MGASVWASGNQVWNGNTGSLIANPMMVRKNRTDAGIMRFAAAILSGSSVMSKVLVEKYSASIPTSINALPNMVKITNFIAEYSFRPVPQMEIRKNIGISSSSQNRKNRKKSRAVKTPITAP